MHLKNLLKVSCFAMLCFFVMPAMAQNKVITGKVTDSRDGSSLVGVSIVAKGSTIGTNTDANGGFKLSIPVSATTIVVSYIGYTTQEVTAVGDQPLDIKLVPTETSLNEVVVVSVGYGTQRKKDLTGAVANIGAKDFNQGAIINPLDQIQGKVAGVVITEAGGDPNQTATIRLRGQTSISGDQSPLFVVDGIQLSDPNQFQNIAPGDIESYDVLKDASATAIYGSRGANGVIIVNTKKGKAGHTQVEYNGYVSTASQAKYFDMLTTPEYLATPQAIAAPQTAQGESDNTNTNWQKAIARTAFTESNNLAISGGTGEFNYRASVNYSDQEGIVINSDKQQLGLRFNAEQKALNDKLDIVFGISNVATNRSLTNASDIGYVWNALPTIPVRLANGQFNDFGDGFNAYNPVEYLDETYNKHNEYLTDINGSINYNILPNLKIGTTGSTTRNNVQTHYFVPAFAAQQSLSQANQYNYNTNSYTIDAHIDYNVKFGKSTLNITAVAEHDDFIDDNFFAAAQDLLVPEGLDNNLSTGSSPVAAPIGSYKEEYELSSLLGRAEYNYDSRFYATASIRDDKSSKFGANYQDGYFPSGSLAYRLKRDLFKSVDWINDFKLRLGIGETGNQAAIGDYTSLGLVAPGGTTNGGAGSHYFDGATGNYPSYYAPSQNPNPYLKWETRIGRNIGADFSLFNDRLSGDIDYYNDKTNNLLFNSTVAQPPNLIGTTFENVGALTNKGLEIQLTGVILKGDGLNWTASGNINFTKTRIVNLSGTAADGSALNTSFINVGSAQGQGLSSNPITRFVPGYAPYVFYLPHFTGVDAQGNEEFDGKTLAQWPGSTPPSHYIDPSQKFNYGLNNTFNYKNWSFSFFLRGVYGQKIFDNTLLDYESVTRLPTTNTTRAALTNGVTSAPTASDRWLENASYLRLDNANIGYTFNHIKGLNTLRIYIATNNLFVITKYRGLDPEVNVNSSDGTLGPQNYIDADYNNFAYYPRERSFTFGANVSFK
jgi:TonB-linked SusC/RagA family outer membrane protein